MHPRAPPVRTDVGNTPQAYAPPLRRMRGAQLRPDRPARPMRDRTHYYSGTTALSSLIFKLQSVTLMPSGEGHRAPGRAPGRVLPTPW